MAKLYGTVQGNRGEAHRISNSDMTAIISTYENRLYSYAACNDGTDFYSSSIRSLREGSADIDCRIEYDQKTHKPLFMSIVIVDPETNEQRTVYAYDKRV